MPRIRIQVSGEIELYTKDARGIAGMIDAVEGRIAELREFVRDNGGTVTERVELLTGRGKARPPEPELPLSEEATEAAVEAVERVMAGEPATDADKLREIGDTVKAGVGQPATREPFHIPPEVDRRHESTLSFAHRIKDAP